ncbi:MAG: dihydrodipicolinate synthase family protein [Bryobacteraceae bacterium]|jgi:dihydrodipicolinate synthase/N-acetylneuraminate lyase
MPSQTKTAPEARGRRDFLKALSGGALASALAFNQLSAAAKPGSKPMRGLFPIGSTPFTDSNQLDLECLAAEIKFLNRGGVHGVIWPQIASEWTTLSKQERLDGAEAMVAAGKGGKTAITIGVQGPDMATVLEYTKHADKIGADAICSLPPEGVTDENAVFDYYKQIGMATDLPLFVQSQPFPMSMDLIFRMYKEIPSFRQIKDEAGDTLARITEIRNRTDDGIKVFTGNGVRNMITELLLGAQGFCPTVDLGDIYAQTYDLWSAGKHSEAFDMFGRVLCFGAITQTVGAPAKYVLVARGVFKNTRSRRGMMAGAAPGAAARGGEASPEGRGGGGRRGPSKPFDAEGEKTVRAALDLLKPYMRA